MPVTGGSYFAAAEAESMDSERIYNWLATAHERGAQVAKLALTITSARHLLEVFTAMENYYRDTAGQRLFLVAGMGKIGTASRLVGGVFRGACGSKSQRPGTSNCLLTSRSTICARKGRIIK